MQAVAKTSPYIRKPVSTKRMMADVLIGLLPILAFATYRYGMDYLLKVVVASLIAVVAEAVVFGIIKEQDETYLERFKTKYTINNVIPPIVTAVIFMFTLPATVSYYVVVVGILFAIVVVKMIFGGLGRNVFNPAGAARVFVGLALGSFITYVDIDGAAGATALSVPFSEVFRYYSISDLFFGNIPGSAGEISAIAILIGGGYLLIRRSADFRVVVSSLGVFTILMLVAGLGMGLGVDTFRFVLFQLLSGGLLFGVFFMATDPVTSPYTRPGRMIFGGLIGLLIVLIRLFGNLPEGMVFSLIIANFIVPIIDYKRWTTNQYSKKFVITSSAVIAIFALIVFIGVGGF